MIKKCTIDIVFEKCIIYGIIQTEKCSFKVRFQIICKFITKQKFYSKASKKYPGLKVSSYVLLSGNILGYRHAFKACCIQCLCCYLRVAVFVLFHFVDIIFACFGIYPLKSIDCSRTGNIEYMILAFNRVFHEFYMYNIPIIKNFSSCHFARSQLSI